MAVNVAHIISVYQSFTTDESKEGAIHHQAMGVHWNFTRAGQSVSIPTVTRKMIVMVLDFVV